MPAAHTIERPARIARIAARLGGSFVRMEVQDEVAQFRPVGAIQLGQAIEGVLAFPAILHQSCSFELGKMGRDMALAFGQDFLQFRHGKLFSFQQKQDTQPIRIGGQPERFED